MRKFGAALAISALLVTSGCGGSGSRPSEDELSKALRKGGDSAILPGDVKVSKKAADCVAKALVDSRISDRALKAIVEGNKNYQPTKADTNASIAVGPKILKCLPEGFGN